MGYNQGMKLGQTEEKQQDFSLKEKPSAAETKKDSNSSFVQNLSVNGDGGELVASIKKTQIDAHDELESYKKLLRKRKKKLALRILIFAIVIILLPMFIFIGSMIIDKNGRHDFFGYTFFAIVSPSMEPEIMTNDCVVLKHVNSADELSVGDDIGYIDSTGKVIVHRIIGMNTTASGVEYTTKGINVENSDPTPIKFDSIVGKRVATLRVLGNAVIFFRSTAGIIVFILIFLLIAAGFYISFRLTENITYIDAANREQK